MVEWGMWLVLVFLTFTNCDGHKVWVVPAQVVSVRPPIKGEGENPTCHTVISTMSNTFCVREEPAEVVRLMEKTNG